MREDRFPYSPRLATLKAEALSGEPTKPTLKARHVTLAPKADLEADAAKRRELENGGLHLLTIQPSAEPAHCLAI
jgi:hypothetical protein